MKKVLFTATVDSHILHFHIPYLKYFKDNGYEVHVATNGETKIPYCDVKHIILFERSPIKFNNIKAIISLKKIIDNENFDIIHCHTPMGSVVTRLAALKARKNGTRLIYTAHGFHFYKGASLLNWCIFYPIEKLLSYVTDDLITINKEDYNLAKEKFYAKRLHFVPGVGVNKRKFEFEFFESEKSNLRKNLGLSDKDFVIIYVAEINKNKNQKLAILAINELLKQNSDVKLLLVGKNSGIYQNLVNNLNLAKKVIFTGYRNDIPKLMKISDIAISTSNREGLPVNLIEANMCDLPIIATNCRGNRDVVVDNENGFVAQYDINDIVRKIEITMRDNFKSKNTSKEYELDNILQKMKEIYNIR